MEPTHSCRFLGVSQPQAHTLVFSIHAIPASPNTWPDSATANLLCLLIARALIVRVAKMPAEHCSSMPPWAYAGAQPRLFP